MNTDFKDQGTITFAYANSERQPFNITASMHHPELRISHSSLDFGKVYIASSREARIYLENNSDVEARWSVRTNGVA